MKISNGLRLAAVMVAVCFGLGAQAQYTTVSSTALGGTANLLANGTIYWQPTNAARIGTSGGQILGSPVHATVTAGAWSASLPDALATSPNLCYAVTVIDNVSGAKVLGAGLAANGIDVNPGGAYGCVQPTGSTWTFDTYVPPAAPPVIYAPVPGPTGSNGAAGVNGTNGRDGSNGSNCPSTDPPGDCSMGNVKAKNVVSPIQPMNPYALRQTVTKASQIAYNRTIGGANAPAQIYLLTQGDSTGLTHTGALACTLAAQYGYAGFIVEGLTGTLTEGLSCPHGAYRNADLSGGATLSSGDFAHFPNGAGWVMPNGGTVITPSSAYFYHSTRQIAYYTADTTGVSINVSYTSDGTTWTTLSNGSGSLCSGTVTPGVGGVCDTSIAEGFYRLRITATGGTVYLWGTGQVDTAINGVVYEQVSVSGMGIGNPTITPDALTAPWYANMAPDLITSEWKANGVRDTTCDFATVAAPSTYHTYAYWVNQLFSKYQAAAPLADYVMVGDYDINTTNCVPAINEVFRNWAASQTRPQTYVDLFSLMPYGDEVSYGWLASGGEIHQNALGRAAGGALLVQYLGVMQWPSAFTWQDVLNNTVTTTQLNLPAATLDGTFDLNVHLVRSLQIHNKADDFLWAYLADPRFGSSASNFLPPFQLSDAAGAQSGKWVTAPSGHPGIYDQPWGNNRQPWYMSTAHITDISVNDDTPRVPVRVVASGTVSLSTSAIAAGICSTTSVTATGVFQTDPVSFSPNANTRLNQVTGYIPSTAGGLTIVGFTDWDVVRFDVCNWSSASITPGAVSLNWKVTR